MPLCKKGASARRELVSHIYIFFYSFQYLKLFVSFSPNPRDMSSLTINMERKNHPIEMEHNLIQTSIFGFKMLIFQGVSTKDPSANLPCECRRQVYRKAPYGKECDMWSVGIIMFEVCRRGKTTFVCLVGDFFTDSTMGNHH